MCVCVCGGGSGGGGGGGGGGGVKLMSVNSSLSKNSFDSKSFVVIMSLVLISGVFQVTLSDHYMSFTSVSCYCMTSFKVACVV